MPFQPGNTEWQKAQKNKPFTDALRMEAAALDQGQIVKHPKGSLRWNAQRLLLNGEVPAVKEVADRLDGRPHQTSETTVTRVDARQLTDDELANIAVGGGEGDSVSPPDSSQLN